MLHSCAEYLTHTLYRHCPLSEEKRPVFVYGFELSLSTLSSILSIILLSIIETKNPVFTVLKRQRCRNAQEVNDISTPFYTPFRPVVRYSNYRGYFLRLNPGWSQETNIDPDN